MEIISRKQAKEQGLKRYFTGKPCKHGHINERLTSNGTCLSCDEVNTKRYLNTEGGKLTRKIAQSKYLNTEYGLKRRRESARKYAKSYRGKITRVKYEQSTNGKLSDFIRRSVKRVLGCKSSKHEKLLGYTGQQLKSHLESQFTDGMSWDNYGFGEGKWVIDHKYPIAQHIRDGETDPSVINALDNLQPMWFKENLEKSDKVY